MQSEQEEQDVPEEPAKSPEEPLYEEDEDISKPMSEVLGNKPKEEPKDDSVPLAKYLELKSELAAAKSQEMTKSEEKASLKDLAEEYDVDLDFVQKLASTISSEAQKKAKEEYEPFLKQQQEKERTQEQNKVFESVYEKAILAFPDLEGSINKNVIKALAFDEKNSNKSVKDIINEVYGGVIERVESAPGASFEKPSTGTRKSTGLDYSNLSKEDHDAIASDPSLKKGYGDWLEKNLSL